MQLGCRRSQKNFSVIDCKMTSREQFLVLKGIHKSEFPKIDFWPYFNFVDFRAYFGPFSHVNRDEHKNLSLNFNLLSITLKFFCDLIQPNGMSG